MSLINSLGEVNNMNTGALVATTGTLAALAGGAVYAWGQGWLPNIPPASDDPIWTLYVPIGLVAGGVIALFFSITKE